MYMELNECEGQETALTGKGCMGYSGFYEEPDKKTEGKDLDKKRGAGYREFTVNWLW